MTAQAFSSRLLEGACFRLARRPPGRWLLRAAARARPTAPAVRRALLRVDTRELRWCEAVEHARSVLRADPRDLGARLALGQALLRLGFLDDALRAFEQVVDAEPLHLEARRQLGLIYWKRDRRRDARRCYEVLSADRRSPRGLALLARALEEEGQIQAARELRLEARALIEAACHTPADFRLRVAIERALGREGRLESAALAALRAFPHHPYLTRRWVLDLLRCRDLGAEPLALVEAWFEAHPQDEERWQLEALSQLRAGKHADAALLLLSAAPAARERRAWSMLMQQVQPEHFAHGAAAPRAEPARLRPARSDLAAVCCHFNPRHFRSRLHNFRVFHRHASASGVRLLTVELAFGDDPFELDGLPGVVQVRGGDVMWQKERLLNLGIGRLIAEGFDKIAWLDADVVFENPRWPDAISQALDELVVCQAFDRVHVRDFPDDPGCYMRGIGYEFELRRKASMRGDGVGFAWAARAELLARVPLYDAAVIGGGDRAVQMASGLSGLSGRAAMRSSVPPRALDHLLHWADAWRARVGGRVGYVPQPIQALPHGLRSNRRYRSRYDVLFEHDFHPESDLALDASGCWRWASDKPALHRAVADYFVGRSEDGA